jgi:hypothetical protein
MRLQPAATAKVRRWRPDPRLTSYAFTPLAVHLHYEPEASPPRLEVPSSPPRKMTNAASFIKCTVS